MSVSGCRSSLLRLFTINKSPNHIFVRYARNKHRTVRFGIINSYQPWAKPIEIKELYGDFDRLNPSELRDSLRRKGILPSRTFDDRPINLNCTDVVFDEYVPPEGDGKSSFLSLSKAKDQAQSGTIALKNITETRQIRKYDPDFKRSQFVDVGEKIYREVMTLLPDHARHQSRLLELVTEKGLSEMLNGLHNKTLVHKFIKHIEKPSLVWVRTEKGTTEGQIFAQITLRLFSEQMVAIYDKFGRLIYGSNDLPQDILEYVVFEKQVSEEFGCWRLHAKIIPDWLPRRLVYQRTSRQEEAQSG